MFALTLLFCLPISTRAESVVYDFDISQRRLDKALISIASQTRLPILFPVMEFKGLQCKAVQGRYTAEQALEQLLQDTGFTAVLGHNSIISIVAVPEQELRAVPTRRVNDVEPEPVQTPFLEEVVVSGIKQSTALSTFTKKYADQILDVISAEDVGKFADDSVAEALQRLSGVQVVRDETGEINNFQVRGISQNRIEINGRSPTAGEGEGRNPNLNDIPVELIASLELSKSHTADQVEGSLGATINLITNTPLTFKQGLNKVSINGSYGDNIETLYPSYAALISRAWRETAIGDVGALLNLAFHESEDAGDIIRVNEWGLHCPYYALTRPDGSLLRGDGLAVGNCDRIQRNIPDAELVSIYGPRSFSHLQYEEQQRRNSVNTTFEWRPNAYSEYLLDLTFINKQDHQTRDTLRIRTHQRSEFIDTSRFIGLAPGAVISGYENTQLLAHEVAVGTNGERHRPVVYADVSSAYIDVLSGQGLSLDTDRLTSAFKAKWQFGQLTLSSEINYSRTQHRRHYVTHQIRRWSGNPLSQSNQVLRVDEGEAIRTGGSDAIIHLGSGRRAEIDWRGHSLNDPLYFRLGSVQDDGWVHKPRERALRLDGLYALGDSVMSSVAFGLRWSRNSQQRTSRFLFRCDRNYNFGANGPNSNSFQTGDRACEDPSVSFVDFANAHPDAVKQVSGFYDQQNSGSPTGWIQLDPALRFNHFDQWQRLYGFDQTSEAVPLAGYQELPGQVYRLGENTEAAYLKLNIEGSLSPSVAYSGNAGIRGVTTSMRYYSAVADDIENLDGNGNTTHDLEWLPSVNLALSFDDELILRLAVSKAMVRPEFSQIKPAGSFNRFTSCAFYDERNTLGFASSVAVPDPEASAATQLAQQAQLDALDSYNPETQPCPGIREENANSIGNPQLRPFTSWNYDLSVERYWKQINYLTLTYFYRDISAGIVPSLTVVGIAVEPERQQLGSAVNGVELWRVERSENGADSVRQGVELAYSQFFDFLPSPLNGLGMSANYTYSAGSQERVIGLSENAYNMSLFYEKYGLSARLSFNYRDDFALGNSLNQSSSQRLDFASSYSVGRAFRFNFNVQNLLREARHIYEYHPSITREVGYSDRIYTVGLDYKF